MSLLDTEDILINNTGLEYGFPEKNNIVYDITDPCETRYYIWQNSTIFLRLYQITHNKMWLEFKTIFVSWRLKNLITYDNGYSNIYKEYYIGLYISKANKTNIIPRDPNITTICLGQSKNYEYNIAKKKAYDILTHIKTDPCFIKNNFNKMWSVKTLEDTGIF